MLAFLHPSLGLDEFHSVLNRRSGRWYSACLRITRDEGLAEDAVQEALLKAWSERGSFRREADLDTWIHRIALNAAIDLMRRRGLAGDQTDDDDLQAAPASISPENAYTQRAIGRDLGAAMRGLTDMERQSFVLKHLEGWQLSEIAERHGTSVNNTKQALFRAVKKLRVAMQAWRGEP